MMLGEDIYIITAQYYIFNLLNCSEEMGVGEEEILHCSLQVNFQMVIKNN